MTPSDIANKQVHPVEVESTTPGMHGVMVTKGGLTFRELAAIHVHPQMAAKWPAMPETAALATLRHIDALAAELAKTPAP